MHFDINSIIQEFLSTAGSNEEIMNPLQTCYFEKWPQRNWWWVNISIFVENP